MSDGAQKVRSGTHWVLITGATSSPNNWEVNDPGFSQTTYSYSDMSEFVVYSTSGSLLHYVVCCPRFSLSLTFISSLTEGFDSPTRNQKPIRRSQQQNEGQIEIPDQSAHQKTSANLAEAFLH